MACCMPILRNVKHDLQHVCPKRKIRHTVCQSLEAQNTVYATRQS